MKSFTFGLLDGVGRSSQDGLFRTGLEYSWQLLGNSALNVSTDRGLLGDRLNPTAGRRWRLLMVAHSWKGSFAVRRVSQEVIRPWSEGASVDGSRDRPTRGLVGIGSA